VDLKEHIVQESLKLFSLKGYLSTSIQDILEAAGASKGGLYNHFKSKEDLFYAVLSEARKLWRERNLDGIDQIGKPIGKLERILENYRDRYLKDTENFPGGCVFVALAVELDDQLPHLGREISEGFSRLRAMIKRLLDQAQESEDLGPDVNTEALTEMIFAGMIGSSVLYSMEKSSSSLDRTISSLIECLNKPVHQGSLGSFA
jgi:TetR/AcrR family transcriptional repressor of nem operon